MSPFINSIESVRSDVPASVVSSTGDAWTLLQEQLHHEKLNGMSAEDVERRMETLKREVFRPAELPASVGVILSPLFRTEGIALSSAIC